jgi:NitT/TauT family transport system permease protein
MTRRFVWAFSPPLVFGVAFLLLWQLFVRADHIKSYVLPAPSAIWTALRANHSRILTAAEHTGLNAFIGLLAGVLVAVVISAIVATLPVADEMITPLVAALATMPIVALAPLLNDMYATTSTLPRRIVVAISAFIPIFMNFSRGLKRVSPVHAELMSSYAASGAAVLRTVRIPGALPHFFAGLRIAASLSVISAVVTEYFGGLQDGLGSRITSAVSATDYPSAWASVVGSMVLGLLFYVVALLIERVVMHSHISPSAKGNS